MSAREKIMKFIKRYNEFIALPVALLLFFIAPSLYRLVDPTAGQFDAGMLQVVVMGIIKFLVASGVAWLGLMASFPILYKYFDDEMEKELIPDTFSDYIKEKSKWSTVISLFIYFSYFFALVLLMLIV